MDCIVRRVTELAEQLSVSLSLFPVSVGQHAGMTYLGGSGSGSHRVTAELLVEAASWEGWNSARKTTPRGCLTSLTK